MELNNDKINDLKDKIKNINTSFNVATDDSKSHYKPFDMVKNVNKIINTSFKVKDQRLLKNNKKNIDKIKINNEELEEVLNISVAEDERALRYKNYLTFREILGFFPTIENSIEITAEHVVNADGLGANITESYGIATQTDAPTIEEKDEQFEKNFLKDFKNFAKLDDKVFKKAVSMQRDGDYFEELIPTADIEKYSVTVLTENKEFLKDIEAKPFTMNKKKVFVEKFAKNFVKYEKFSEEQHLLMEVNNTLSSSDDYLDLLKAKMIIKTHKPENVVKIEIDGIVIGYIIFNKQRGYVNKSSGTFEDYASDYVSIRMDKDSEEKTITLKQDFINKTMFSIKEKIAAAIKSLNITDDEKKAELIYKTIKSNKELEELLKYFILSDDKLYYRYVLPENMFHYKRTGVVGSDDTYGESIFLTKIHDLRTIWKMKNMLASSSINNAIEKEMVLVDVDTENDVSNSINNLMSSFKTKEKALFEKINTTELQAFKVSPTSKLYVPRINGETPFEITTIPTKAQNISKDDVKLYQDDVLNGMRVPSSMLDSANATYHTSMGQESMLFATVISRYQKDITKVDTLMAKRGLVLLGKTKVKIVKYQYSITPPINLMLEGMETKINSIMNISDSIAQVYLEEDDNGIKSKVLTKLSIAKEITPQINWEKFDALAEIDTDKMEEVRKKNKASEDDMGGM